MNGNEPMSEKQKQAKRAHKLKNSTVHDQIISIIPDQENTGIIKDGVFPNSFLLEYFNLTNPSLVILDNGKWLNFSTPAFLGD